MTSFVLKCGNRFVEMITLPTRTDVKPARSIMSTSCMKENVRTLMSLSPKKNAIQGACVPLKDLRARKAQKHAVDKPMIL